MRAPFFILWCLCLAACSTVDTIGSVDTAMGDTAIGATDDDNSDSVGDTATGDSDESMVYTAMPFTPPNEPGATYIWVAGDSNPLALRGQWYVYSDSLSTAEIENGGDGIVCTAGSLSGDVSTYNFAGIGFNVCNNGLNHAPYYQVFTLETCPFADNLEEKIVGVSFAATGTLPGNLSLSFKEPELQTPTYALITDGALTEYLFKDALPGTLESAPLNEGNIVAFQFQLWNPTDSELAFDFCIRDVHILVRE